MPRSLPQLVGIVVTGVIVLGCDHGSTLTAMLGMVAGAVATFFVAANNHRRAFDAPGRD